MLRFPLFPRLMAGLMAGLMARLIAHAPLPRVALRLVLPALFPALLFSALPSTASAKAVRTDYVESELIARTAAIEPGGKLLLGLRLKMDPHWHTYWQNPGDSGMPTTIQWKLPAGFKAGPIQWPLPQRLPIAPMMNYGYENEIVLPVEISVPKDGLLSLLGQPARLAARADWLVCKDVCLPGGADLELTLPVVQGNPAPDARWTALFDKALAALPARVLTGVTATTSGGMIEITLPGAKAVTVQGVYLFPAIEGLVEHAAPQTVRETAAGLVLRVPVISQLVASEPRMAGVITGIVTGNEARPVSFDAPMSGKLVPGKWVAPAAIAITGANTAANAGPSTGPNGGTAATTAAIGGADTPSFGLALLFAFVGGLILNLMPCVFPVLSLKILSFARGGDMRNEAGAQTGRTTTTTTTRRGMRIHGIAFAIGVITSFVALAAALLSLRAAGEAVGWGFQLQSPLVVTLLALLFFVIGLNLSGVFEMANLVPHALAGAAFKHPAADAFFSGVLAALVASPCTAPFMGAALGFALTQSAAAALVVFAVMGAGMALPYVLLSWFPAWLKRLPRPGAWLITFKQVMAFPMYATVVWLAWVLLVQVGVDGLVWFGSALVVLAFGVWLLGKSQHGIGRAAAVAAILAALFIANPPAPTVSGKEGDAKTAQAGATTATAASAATAAGSPAQWDAYSKARIAEHNAAGRAVFVDFTAAWCVTCQVNKKVVLETRAVREAFSARPLALMRADWTRRDPAITAALAEFGRSGVPVYALYAPGKAPVLLPEILTERIVLDALKSL